MLKYVGILQTIDWQIEHRWHSGTSKKIYKSPVSTNKKFVEEWLEIEKQKYCNVMEEDSVFPHHRYSTNTAILAFDEEECENLKYFLEKIMCFY